tara:strand:- start:405 stop:545 length:141 start_codon:yes stop_codon:yes gene_type:complete
LDELKLPNAGEMGGVSGEAAPDKLPPFLEPKVIALPPTGAKITSKM